MGGVSEIQEDREGQVTQTCPTLFVGCDSETICRAGSTFFDSGRDKTAADLESLCDGGLGLVLRQRLRNRPNRLNVVPLQGSAKCKMRKADKLDILRLV